MTQAIEKFRRQNSYPTGQIQLEMPPEELLEGQDTRQILSTKGGSDLSKTSQGLAVSSGITGGMGLVMLFTPAAPAGLFFLGFSAVTGVAASATGIAAEQQKDNPSNEIIALEALGLISAMLAVKGSWLSSLNKQGGQWFTWSTNMVDNTELLCLSATTVGMI